VVKEKLGIEMREEEIKKWKEYTGKDVRVVSKDIQNGVPAIFSWTGKLLSIDSGFVYVKYKGRTIMIPYDEIMRVEVL